MTTRDCPFCNPAPADLLCGDALVYALADRYPVTPGHSLVCTRRHVADWFDATPDEQLALLQTVSRVRDLLTSRHAPDGFNIGVNCGPAAGQTIAHLHVHVIPRYRGDMADPRGGVRGVIPARQHYHTPDSA